MDNQHSYAACQQRKKRKQKEKLDKRKNKEKKENNTLITIGTLKVPIV